MSLIFSGGEKVAKEEGKEEEIINFNDLITYGFFLIIFLFLNW